MQKLTAQALETARARHRAAFQVLAAAEHVRSPQIGTARQVLETEAARLERLERRAARAAGVRS